MTAAKQATQLLLATNNGRLMNGRAVQPAGLSCCASTAAAGSEAQHKCQKRSDYLLFFVEFARLSPDVLELQGIRENRGDQHCEGIFTTGRSFSRASRTTRISSLKLLYLKGIERAKRG
jgi:hypothetical protein